MRKGVYVGLSSIFFLSILAFFASNAMAGDTPGIDRGDHAWMLISTALVLIMTPGLALFYGGMVRAKNMVNTLWLSFICMGVVGVMWVLWGYSLSFSPGCWFIGGLKWCLLGSGVVGQAPSDLYATSIPHLTFMMFQGMFAIITPALITGAFAERMKFNAWLLLILLWCTAVYPPIAHWVWSSEGWLLGIQSLDFAGGTVVHICSGASALAVILILGRRKGHPKEAKPPHHLPFVMLGTGLLWFGWFGFNAGSALVADGLAANAFVVTNTAAAAGAVTWSFIEWALHKRPTILGACSGAVAGLVAITPAAGFVGPMASIGIGVPAAILCYLAVAKMKKALGYDDALDVIGVHAVGGTWGAFATGLFADSLVNPAAPNGLFHGNPSLLGKQIIGIFAAWAWAFCVTALLTWFVKAVVGLRPTEAEEDTGMDLTQHKEISYHYYEAQS